MVTSDVTNDGVSGVLEVGEAGTSNDFLKVAGGEGILDTVDNAKGVVDVTENLADLTELQSTRLLVIKFLTREEILDAVDNKTFICFYG